MPYTHEEEKYREMEKRQEDEEYRYASRFWEFFLTCSGCLIAAIMVVAAIYVALR